MPDDGPRNERFRVVCPCGNWANSEPVDTFGTTPAEEFNAVAAMMAPLGWTVGPKDEAGQRSMICPGCSRAAVAVDEPIETVRLPVYRVKGPCPKCGVLANIETVYRRGDEVKRAYAEEPPCESLLRICTRCGYKWSEACIAAKAEARPEPKKKPEPPAAPGPEPMPPTIETQGDANA